MSIIINVNTYFSLIIVLFHFFLYHYFGFINKNTYYKAIKGSINYKNDKIPIYLPIFLFLKIKC